MIKPSSYNTLQELIDGGFTITIYCHNPRCHHRAELDLKKLSKKLGPDHGALFGDLKYKLVCGRCRGRVGGLFVGGKRPPSGGEHPLGGDPIPRHFRHRLRAVVDLDESCDRRLRGEMVEKQLLCFFHVG
jgi:hypothetical protein